MFCWGCLKEYEWPEKEYGSSGSWKECPHCGDTESMVGVYATALADTIDTLANHLEEWEKRRRNWEAALKDADQQLASAKAEGERLRVLIPKHIRCMNCDNEYREWPVVCECGGSLFAVGPCPAMDTPAAAAVVVEGEVMSVGEYDLAISTEQRVSLVIDIGDKVTITKRRDDEASS